MHPKTAFQRCSILIGILTLAILSCSSVANVASIFATATLTPTNTFTPSPTLTPSPTSTPTQTPSPTPTPKSRGVNAEKQTDGTTIFSDYDNQYQLSLPPSWKVVFASKEELQHAVQNSGINDPKFTELAEKFKQADPDVFRLAAMNVDRKYISASSPTLLTINTVEDSLAGSMPMAFVTAMIEDGLLKGSTSTTWDVVNNQNGVEVGVVEGTKIFDVPTGLSIRAREQVIAFQSNGKLILVEIMVPEEFQEEILATFEDAIQSIKVSAE